MLGGLKPFHQESTDMTLAYCYTKIMMSSSGCFNPLTSPAAALVGKIGALLWVFGVQG